MTDLTLALSSAVQAEYAQWLRYTYLSALGWGLHSDTLREHFQEHCSDELEHAKLVSRWIVDLGCLPPCDFPSEQPPDTFNNPSDAIGWLLGAEIDGVNLYHQVLELACGIPGLEADIEEILQCEHEHISDLMRLYERPVDVSDTVIIVAAHNPERALRIASHKKEAIVWSQAIDMLRGILAPHTNKPMYNIEEGQRIALEGIEDLITEWWPKRETPEVKRNLQNWKLLYEMIQDTKSWQELHQQMFPDFQPKSLKPHEELGFGDIMEQIDPGDPGEVLEVDRAQAPYISPVGKGKEPTSNVPQIRNIEQALPQEETQLASEGISSISKMPAKVLRHDTRSPTMVPVGVDLYNSTTKSKGKYLGQSGDKLVVGTNKGNVAWSKDDVIYTSVKQETKEEG